MVLLVAQDRLEDLGGRRVVPADEVQVVGEEVGRARLGDVQHRDVLDLAELVVEAAREEAVRVLLQPRPPARQVVGTIGSLARVLRQRQLGRDLARPVAEHPRVAQLVGRVALDVRAQVRVGHPPRRSDEVLAAVLFGRSIRYPAEVPVGTIVGVVGGLVFLFILVRSRS